MPAGIRERGGVWAFVVAGLSAPFALVLPVSCGAACGACPAVGGCFLVPATIVGIVALRSRLKDFWVRLRGTILAILPAVSEV